MVKVNFTTKIMEECMMEIGHLTKCMVKEFFIMDQENQLMMGNIINYQFFYKKIFNFENKYY